MACSISYHSQSRNMMKIASCVVSMVTSSPFLGTAFFHGDKTQEALNGTEKGGFGSLYASRLASKLLCILLTTIHAQCVHRSRLPFVSGLGILSLGSSRKETLPPWELKLITTSFPKCWAGPEFLLSPWYRRLFRRTQAALSLCLWVLPIQEQLPIS